MLQKIGLQMLANLENITNLIATEGDFRYYLKVYMSIYTRSYIVFIVVILFVIFIAKFPPTMRLVLIYCTVYIFISCLNDLFNVDYT